MTPLVIDSFAGGGGASTGIEMALADLDAAGILPAGHRLHVHYAINHDPAALAMHVANHPQTIHMPHNVWQVSLRAMIGDAPIGLLWMSPDCRHHSKAKGGAPVSASVRDLAWVAMRWLKELRPEQLPQMVFLENVEEFADWGPLVDDGSGGRKPCPDRRGETFRLWIKEWKRLGYRIEWRELRACHYGAPTIRKRLYIVARKDGQPIAWPAPTHGDPKSDAVRSGKLQPWPVAADIIDWSLPCPSIFLTKDEAREHRKRTGRGIIRPLARNTEARIAKGVKRYVLDAAKPFVVGLAHGDSGGRRWYDVEEPLTTVQPKGNKQAVVVPHVMTMRNAGKPHTAADEAMHTVTAGGASLSVVEAEAVPFVSYGQQGGANRPADAPHHTVKASKKDTNCVVVPSIVGVGGRMGQSGPRPVGAPWHTVTTKPDSAIAVPYLVPRYGERPGQEPRTRDAAEPMPTIVPTGNGGDLAAVYLAQHNEHRIGQSAEEPVPTVTTRGTQTHVVAASFVKRDSGGSIGHAMDDPLGTVTPGGGGKADVVTAFLAQHNNDSRRIGGVNPGRPVDEPLATIVGSGSQQNIVTAHMLSMKGEDRRTSGCDEPHPTICTGGRKGGQQSAVVQLPLMTAYYGTGEGAPVDEPLRTATTRDRFGLVDMEAMAPPISAEQVARAREVAEFLRRYGCWTGGEFVTVSIENVVYIVVDIGMRMLTAHELARAQSFPDSYILAAPFGDGFLTDTEQRHKIGNSVCPVMARALVRANYRPQLVARPPVEEFFMEAAE